jgi:hypothetical protein
MKTKTFRKTLLTLLLLLGASLLLISTSTAVASQVVYDDFNDNSINTFLWTVFQGGSGPTIAETNLRLEIAHPAESAGDIFFAQYISVCQLRGDFDIQADYLLLTWPSANGVRVGLNIDPGTGTDPGTDLTERSSFGDPTADHPGEPRQVYLTHYADGVQGITATSDLSGKLRVVRSGSILTGYYFSSGNWVAIHTGPADTTADVRFILGSWSHDLLFTEQAVKLAFDNVIVNQGLLICPKIKVLIDIKPGSDPNSINCNNADEVITVAILTTDDFDALTVDPNTVLFEEANETHVNKKTFEPRVHEEDVDGDGDTDRVFHFRQGETGLTCTSTEGTLTGQTFGGQSIEGTDSIRMVGGQ